jgi:adenylate kinase
MIIGLFGLSGSGKTTITQKIKQKYPSFYCTSASKILKDFNRPILQKDLITNVLDRNQEILLYGLNEISKKHKNIFIELHSVIEDKDNQIYFVEKNKLISLKLDYVYILDIPAEEILKRRRLDLNKQRNLLSVDDLKKLSELQKKYLIDIFPNKFKLIKSYREVKLSI